ncbi:hypothetical protein TUA1478L_16350 [Lactiplantibacillus plantarum]
MANFAYEVFSTVVAQHTFYQAAATLNVTPSAVSHSINQLEKNWVFHYSSVTVQALNLLVMGGRFYPMFKRF